MIFKEIREDRDKWPFRKTNNVRKTKYTYPEEIKVCSVDLPEDEKHGYSQLVHVTDEVGDIATFKYWYTTLEEGVPTNETGMQLYIARYLPDTDSWQGVPQRASAPDNSFAPTEENKWDKINLGKCRTLVLVAEVQKNGLGGVVANMKEARLRPEVLASINKLAHFSMTGEIE